MAVGQRGTAAAAGGVRRAPAAASDALAEAIKTELGAAWLPRLYRERILPLRTRAYQLPAGGATEVAVQHTLLGVELKVGRRRLSCPDLATARYLAVFARAGVAAVAVPYDITRTSPLADELESSWQRMLLLVERDAAGRTPAFRARVRRRLLEAARREMEEAGAGAPVPQFNQNTKQRPGRA
ncbi:MAG TPA: hypothetical protein VF546_07525 [Pyrinomonadaceae bacterium]|jgi:hypothetical protein